MENFPKIENSRNDSEELKDPYIIELEKKLKENSHDIVKTLNVVRILEDLWKNEGIGKSYLRKEMEKFLLKIEKEVDNYFIKAIRLDKY